ncbi:MAG: YihY/virulence factor BrkB family protein [Vicinamibacterales bacterium]
MPPNTLRVWRDVAARTWRAVIDDDVPGLAAQLSFYFFLALFPSLLFLLALGSFFPLGNLTDDAGRLLAPFASPPIVALIQGQMQRLANSGDGGLLTFGGAAAIWSSSAAFGAIVGALNRACGVDDRRSWWTVRLIAVALMLGVTLLILAAFALVLAGPAVAAWLGRSTGWGRPFEWAWLAVQWPIVVLLVATGIGLLYRFGPDTRHRVTRILPGAVAATALWVLISLAFKVYIARFTDYEGAYGTVGGVIVLLLWFYVSGIAVLAGAELNAEIARTATGAPRP